MKLEQILKLSIPLILVGTIAYQGIQWYREIKYFGDGYLTKVREKGL